MQHVQEVEENGVLILVIDGVKKIWRCKTCAWWVDINIGRCKVCGEKRDGEKDQTKDACQ